jgi:hypothetical protein
MSDQVDGLHAKQMPTDRSIWPLTLVYQTNLTYCNISESNGQRKHIGSGGNDSFLATSSHGDHGAQCTAPAPRPASNGWLNKAQRLSHLQDNRPQESLTQNTNKFY